MSTRATTAKLSQQNTNNKKKKTGKMRPTFRVYHPFFKLTVCMLLITAFGSRADIYNTHFAAVCGSSLWVFLLVDQVQHLQACVPDSF